MSVRKRKRQDAKPTELKRCAIYTRKSTEEGLDQEFNTLDAQREAGEAFITSQKHQGWECMPDKYDDGGFTGANMERPALRRLMDDIEDEKVDVVVVYKVDRLSRSLLDFARLMAVFEERQVSFVSVTQQFNTASSMGRLVLNVLLSFAQFEREMIAERTRDKIAAARRRGKWTGGQVPLGYDIVDKKLVINDLEAVLVREVFDLYEDRGSALAVATALNERGVTTKRHQSKRGRVSGGKDWNKDAVLRAIKNPVYVGFITCGGERYVGEHEAIVDKVQFARVQAQLANMDKHGVRHGRNPEYLLRGILKCGDCGQAMTTASTRKNDRVYRYYRCTKRDKKGKKVCPAGQIPAEAIETFVVERISEASLGGLMSEHVHAELKQRIEQRRARLKKERKNLPAWIAKLADEGSRLADKVYGMSDDGARLMEDRIEKVGAQLAKAEVRLAEVERDLAELKRSELQAGWVATTLGSFDAVWETMTTENRNRLIRALVQKVEVNEAAGEVTVVLTDLRLPDLDDDTPEDKPPKRSRKPKHRAASSSSQAEASP